MLQKQQKLAGIASDRGVFPPPEKRNRDRSILSCITKGVEHRERESGSSLTCRGQHPGFNESKPDGRTELHCIYQVPKWKSG